MTVPARFIDRIRGFDLLSRLSPEALDALLRRSATVLTYAPGDLIYSQGQDDSFISYLLEGRVERTRNGVFELVIDYDKERRTRPLDAMAKKRHTVHAASAVTVLRLSRRELERAYLDAAPDDATGVLDATDIGAATTNEDWRTRLLGSALFNRLAAPNIQAVFDRMVDIHANAGQEIVRQGEAGGAYYVIQSGTCEVVRTVGPLGQQVHLAKLGPGDGFGEEAAITDTPRNASVRMITDGRLMRLDRADFLELVVKPLVRGVNPREALYLHGQGFVVVDTRAPEAFRAAQVTDAINIPTHLLRAQARDLDKSTSYIVCSDDPAASLLGAFHCVERGLDACYLEAPVAQLLSLATAASGVPTQGRPDPVPHTQPERPSMTKSYDGNGTSTAPPEQRTAHAEPGSEPGPPDARVPREEFTDTITGQELADIIDELYRQRQDIEESDSFVLGGAAPPKSAPLVERAVPSGGQPTTADSPEALVNDIIRDINLKLSQYIKQCIASHQEALTERLKEHAAHIERVAQDKVKAHEHQMREHFEEIYAAKESKLRDDYARLTRLANRLAQQKADIQSTRRKLAEMLQAAQRVNQAVYRAGNALVEQVDHLGQMEDDGNLH